MDAFGGGGVGVQIEFSSKMMGGMKRGSGDRDRYRLRPKATPPPKIHSSTKNELPAAMDSKIDSRCCSASGRGYWNFNLPFSSIEIDFYREDGQTYEAPWRRHRPRI